MDTVLGETCAESTNVGIDYTQTGTEIIDGRTLLLDRDVDCCTLCRTTPGKTRINLSISVVFM